MFGRRRRAGRQELDVRSLVVEHLEGGRPTGWFEPLYAAADGDERRIPWGGAEPHPYVTDWLADPVLVPPGRRAVVVGCGLGGDAAALDDAGYDVVAFDVAPTAVDVARQRLPGTVDVRTLDLLELPEDLVGAFDLVVEVRTVQSLPGVVRDAAMHAVASLAGPDGVVVVVTLLATSAQAASDAEGPPWPQAPSELAAYLAGGLRRVALEHPDPAGERAVDVRCTFVRDPEGPGRTLVDDGGAGRDVLGIGG
ncbi:MAG: methyltransferase domain-containing protein [Nitriliruptor sp.]